jgi:transcriptional antiterminator NusG
MAFRWYVLRTFSGHENKVKTALEKEIEFRNLQPYIKQILIPAERVFEVKDGKTKSKKKSFFPGYILIEAELDKKIMDIILSIPSVMGFLGTKNRPQPLQPQEVERLLTKVQSEEAGERIESPFKIGDPIVITSGPFAKMKGTVQEVNNEKLKLKVMVSIFGRKTPLEIDFTQAELEK